MKKTIKILRFTVTAVIAVFAVMYCMDLIALPDLFSIGSIGGGFYAAAPGVTIVGEGVTESAVTKDTTINLPDVSQKVTKMRPSATPLDTIMRSIGGNDKANNVKVEYYSVAEDGFEDEVATEMASVDGIGTLPVANVQLWKPSDTVLIKGVLGSDGKDIMCYVAAVDRANNTLKIELVEEDDAATTVLPLIGANTKLLKMAPAMYETDAQAAPYGKLPEKDFNYCQIYMAQVEESFFQRMQSKEIDWGFTDFEEQNIYQMKSAMEFTGLFGRRGVRTSKNDDHKRYFAGGIYRNIDKHLTYGSGGADRTIDNAKLISICKDVFKGNSGSDRRIMFGGSDFTQFMSNIQATKEIDANKTEVVYGITFNKIETKFGTILYRMHRGFDLAGCTENAMVLDINNIEKKVLQPMGSTDLDLEKAGIRKSKATVLSEISCLITRYPDTHAWIKPKA